MVASTAFPAYLSTTSSAFNASSRQTLRCSARILERTLNWLFHSLRTIQYILSYGGTGSSTWNGSADMGILPPGGCTWQYRSNLFTVHYWLYWKALYFWESVKPHILIIISEPCITQRNPWYHVSYTLWYKSTHISDCLHVLSCTFHKRTSWGWLYRWLLLP